MVVEKKITDNMALFLIHAHEGLRRYWFNLPAYKQEKFFEFIGVETKYECLSDFAEKLLQKLKETGFEITPCMFRRFCRSNYNCNYNPLAKKGSFLRWSRYMDQKWKKR